MELSKKARNIPGIFSYQHCRLFTSTVFTWGRISNTCKLPVSLLRYIGLTIFSPATTTYDWYFFYYLLCRNMNDSLPSFFPFRDHHNIVIYFFIFFSGWQKKNLHQIIPPYHSKDTPGDGNFGATRLGIKPDPTPPPQSQRGHSRPGRRHNYKKPHILNGGIPLVVMEPNQIEQTPLCSWVQLCLDWSFAMQQCKHFSKMRLFVYSCTRGYYFTWSSGESFFRVNKRCFPFFLRLTFGCDFTTAVCYPSSQSCNCVLHFRFMFAQTAGTFKLEKPQRAFLSLLLSQRDSRWELISI